MGPDRVVVKPEEVIIEAKHEMPDWDIREIDPAPIYFEDRKYYLVEQRKGQPGTYAMRYLLKPWPEGRTTSCKLFHAYDLETVTERDGGVRSEHAHEAARLVLMPFYPVLGLLWSGMQRRLTRFGFAPRSISSISIFVCFCLAFGQGVFTVVLLNASMRSNKLMVGGLLRALTGQDYFHLGTLAISVGLLDALMLVALVLDVLMRYSAFLRDDEWHGGFLEWMVPRALRRRSEESEEA